MDFVSTIIKGVLNHLFCELAVLMSLCLAKYRSLKTGADCTMVLYDKEGKIKQAVCFVTRC